MAKEGSKIMANEDDEIIDIDFKTYWSYFTQGGAGLIFLFCLPFYVVYTFCGILQSESTAEWMEHLPHFNPFFMKICLYSLGFGLSITLAFFLIMNFTMRISNTLH